ncbi:hypothetical protein BC830DRAFT_1114794 [Chytriomyces sp. MP71]|nr:hypothetical protein BC830DRAFT_1114794 [Chytriomyces sp. MP71]
MSLAITPNLLLPSFLRLSSLVTDKKKPSSVSDSSAKRRSWGFSRKRDQPDQERADLDYAIKLVGREYAHHLKPTFSEADLYNLTQQKFALQNIPLRNQVQIANAAERILGEREVLGAFRQYFRTPHKEFSRRSRLRVVVEMEPSAPLDMEDLEDSIPLYYFAKAS